MSLRNYRSALKSLAQAEAIARRTYEAMLDGNEKPANALLAIGNAKNACRGVHHAKAKVKMQNGWPSVAKAYIAVVPS